MLGLHAYKSNGNMKVLMASSEEDCENNSVSMQVPLHGIVSSPEATGEEEEECGLKRGCTVPVS